MIKHEDAIATARGLIGTPYSTLDCIGLIKKVIRTAPGGVPSYTTAGTNTLWQSYNSSTKYRDLTWRQESIAGARAGMLAFKRDGEDVHHVGLVTGEGTVIHSSSMKEEVVETALSAAEGWNLLAVHRYIETSSVSSADTFPKGEGLSANEREATDMESYRAQVVLKDQDSVLNVRNEPGKGGDIIGRLHHGAQVTVQAVYENGWMYVAYGDGGVGYVSKEYLQPVNDIPENIITVSGDVTIIDDAGNTFKPVGGWRVVMGSVD